MSKIFIRAIALAAICILAACQMQQERAQGWTTLFDGSSLEAFRGYRMTNFPERGWKIEGNTLRALPGGGADLITREQYDDFELEYEWKVSPGGNSGVFYNVAETDGPAWHTGPEIQVLDDSGHPDGRNPKTSAGSLYALFAPNELKKTHPIGEFNQSRVRIKGNHVEHWLNGAKILEYELGSQQLVEAIRNSKFRDMPRFMKEEKGHIAFQHHGQEVWFRNIRVKKL